jgi:hypothetical protein
MKRIGWIIFIMAVLATAIISINAASASADWRWAPPHFKEHEVTYKYTDLHSLRQIYLRERARLKRKIKLHDQRRLKEWKHWSRLYIPNCTWYGESGASPQFAQVRYTIPNAQGSGAYGKYQMMPGTYFAFAKYGDWSPLDQEIAGHRLFWDQGTSPWTNCH